MQEMENRVRAHLQQAEPSMFNSAGADPMFQSGMQSLMPSPMYASQFGPGQQGLNQPMYSQMDADAGYGGAAGMGSVDGGPPHSAAASMMDGIGSS